MTHSQLPVPIRRLFGAGRGRIRRRAAGRRPSAGLAVAQAQAQATPEKFPSRPMRFIVPFPARQ